MAVIPKTATRNSEMVKVGYRNKENETLKLDTNIVCVTVVK